MSIPFQLVIDAKDPGLLAGFWAGALGYVLEPPPEGFATWDDWRRSAGLPMTTWAPPRTASSIQTVRAPASGSARRRRPRWSRTASTSTSTSAAAVPYRRG